QILEVLVYLQSHKPPIFHRDLKPENILIERSDPLQTYVIDFGFARKGGDNIAMSSVVKGTLGFMPPEQLYNQKITTASDLYSLGMTIVSLLTKTPSYKIGELINHHGKLNYKKALAYEVNKRFIKWLDQMIDTNINNRFPDAKTALYKLQNLDQTKFSLSKIALTSGLSKGIALVILLIIGYSVIKNNPVNNTSNYPQPPVIESSDPLIKQLLETKQCINCNLAGADLSGMNLKGVNLTGANLQNAKFNQTQLESANLNGANLQNADLINSNLTYTNLIGANFKNANLSKSHFENANLMMANFENANLSKAVFWNANLMNTNLENAKNMNDANLKGATLPNGKRYE
ncbi:MAG TPA: pentapeptide repeat-containing protein, partial [Allocoleopsis sp.]